MSLKGMDPMQFAFVSLAIILLFLMAVVSPMQGAIDTAVENSAKLNANFITSTINLVQASPVGTKYIVQVPKAECQINITNKDVTYVVINRNKVYSVDVIQNYKIDFQNMKIAVPTMSITCKKGVFEVRRTENGVDISDVA